MQLPETFWIPGPFSRRSFLLFLAVWAFCLGGFALSGTLPGSYGGDTNRLFIPFRHAAMQSLATGNFPDMVGGMFMGHRISVFGQAAWLYPTNLLGALIPFSDHAFFLGDLWFHAALASTGMAWWLRRRGHHPIICLALGWAFSNGSGFLFRTFGHWTLLHQVALLPWLLGTWEGLGRRVTSTFFVKPAIAPASLAGLILLSQNPQLVLVMVPVVLIMETGRTIRRRKLIPPAQRLLFNLAACTLAVLLGAAGIIPGVVHAGDSYRAMLGSQVLSRAWPLATENLISVLSPYALFGNTVDVFLGKWAPIESVLVTGRGVALLALIGATASIRGWKRMRGRFVLPALLCAAGFIFGVIPETSLYDAWTRVVPFYGSFRAWGRCSILIGMGMILFAAEGARYLLAACRSGILSSRFVISFCSAGVMAAAVVLWNFNQTTIVDSSPATAWFRDIAWWGVWIASVAVLSWRWHRPLHMMAALLLVAEACLFQHFTWQSRSPVLGADRLPEVTSWIRQRSSVVAPQPLCIWFDPPELRNFGLLFPGVRSPGGADANIDLEYRHWFNTVQGLVSERNHLEVMLEHPTREFLETTGLQAIVQRTTDPPIVEGHRIVLGDYAVTEIPDAKPYYECQPEGSVRLHSWAGDAMTLEKTGAGVSSLTIREFPGRHWNARLDGVPLDDAFIPPSISLPQGKHTLDIEFVDNTARWCTGVTVVGWLSVGAWTLANLLRRRAR